MAIYCTHAKLDNDSCKCQKKKHYHSCTWIHLELWHREVWMRWHDTGSLDQNTKLTCVHACVFLSCKSELSPFSLLPYRCWLTVLACLWPALVLVLLTKGRISWLDAEEAEYLWSWRVRPIHPLTPAQLSLSRTIIRLDSTLFLLQDHPLAFM